MKKQAAAVIPKGMAVEDFQKALHCLATSGDHRYQLAAATHPSTSEETLLWLARNATFWGGIGTGPLNEMANRRNLSDEVMFALMDNEHFPDGMFLQMDVLSVPVALSLVKKYDGLKHLSMVRSDKIPMEALRVLAKEAYFPAIQNMAGYSPCFNEELLEIILSRPDMDEQRLECADETKRNWVYLALAINEKIVMPESLQLRIIEDGKVFSSNAHLKRLATRKDLTEKTREILAQMLSKKK